MNIVQLFMTGEREPERELPLGATNLVWAKRMVAVIEAELARIPDLDYTVSSPVAHGVHITVRLEAKQTGRVAMVLDSLSNVWRHQGLLGSARRRRETKLTAPGRLTVLQ